MTFTQYMMATIVMALGASPILMLWSPAGPAHWTTRALSVSVAAGCAVMAVLWATKWPTRGQSSGFAIVATLAIAISCLVTSPGIGMQTCTAFAALAGYVAFFHTARHLVFTLFTAAVTAAVCAAEIAVRGDPFQAVGKLVVLCIGILAVPFCVQVMVHFLGIDALRSDTDALTGLPNRRGFRRSVRMLAAKSSHDGKAQLTVVMVDLDDFKRINDTAGHAAGDRTLTTVGDVLHRTRPAGSVAGRVGGEEFVVALSGDRRDAVGLAERVCREIAHGPAGVTASIGVASASLFRVIPQDVPAHVDLLLESADRAMYAAKRAGGDRVHVVGRPSDAFDEKPTAGATAGAPRATAKRTPSGVDARSMIAAASVDPTPARTRPTPTRIPSEIVNAVPAVASIAKNGL